MLRQWYLARGGAVFGPYTWEEITDFVRQGAVGKNDLLWSRTRAEWTEVSAFSELLPLLNFYTSTPESSRSEEIPTETGPGTRKIFTLGWKKRVVTGAVIGGIAGAFVTGLFSGNGKTTWEIEQKIEKPIVFENVAIEYGTESNQVGYINQNTDPGADVPVPHGPKSFRILNDSMWVLDSVGNKLLKVNSQGDVSKEIQYEDKDKKILAQDFAPVVSDDGTAEAFWIINGMNSELFLVSLSGETEQRIRGNLIQPMRIELDAQNNIIVADDAAKSIVIFSGSGSRLGELDYQWSGFCLADDENTLFKLLYDEESQNSLLTKQNYDGDIVSQAAVELGEHHNPRLWYTDDNNDLFVLTTETPSTNPGELRVIVFDSEGSVKKNSRFEMPIATNRMLEVDDQKRVWSPDVDYRTAPEGNFSVQSIESLE